MKCHRQHSQDRRCELDESASMARRALPVYKIDPLKKTSETKVGFSRTLSVMSQPDVSFLSRLCHFDVVFICYEYDH